jgi:hypothetical protein
MTIYRYVLTLNLLNFNTMLNFYDNFSQYHKSKRQASFIASFHDANISLKVWIASTASEFLR